MILSSLQAIQNKTTHIQMACLPALCTSAVETKLPTWTHIHVTPVDGRHFRGAFNAWAVLVPLNLAYRSRCLKTRRAKGSFEMCDGRSWVRSEKDMKAIGHECSVLCRILQDDHIENDVHWLSDSQVAAATEPSGRPASKANIAMDAA